MLSRFLGWAAFTHQTLQQKSELVSTLLAGKGCPPCPVFNSRSVDQKPKSNLPKLVSISLTAMSLWCGTASGSEVTRITVKPRLLTVEACDIEFKVPWGYRTHSPVRNNATERRDARCEFVIVPPPAVSKSLRADLEQEHPDAVLPKGIENTVVVVSGDAFPSQEGSTTLGAWAIDKGAKHWVLRIPPSQPQQKVVFDETDDAPSIYSSTLRQPVASRNKKSGNEHVDLDVALKLLSVSHAISVVNPTLILPNGALMAIDESFDLPASRYNPRARFAIAPQFCGIAINNAPKWVLLDIAEPGTCDKGIELRIRAAKHIGVARAQEAIAFQYYPIGDPNPTLTILRVRARIEDEDGVIVGGGYTGELRRSNGELSVKSGHGYGNVEMKRIAGYRVFTGAVAARGYFLSGQYCCTTDSPFAAIELAPSNWLTLSGDETLIQLFVNSLARKH
jgi:hypothetical protein